MKPVSPNFNPPTLNLPIFAYSILLPNIIPANISGHTVYQSFGINFPFASQTLPIMLALCLMLLVTYYAKNYAGMIGGSLVPGSQVPFGSTSTSTDKMFTRHNIV